MSPECARCWTALGNGSCYYPRMITISSATHCRVMLAALLVATFIATANSQERPVPDAQTAGHAGQHRWALVMHGGAGVIERSAMTSEADAGYRAGMKQAAEAAEAILNRGGS